MFYARFTRLTWLFFSLSSLFFPLTGQANSILLQQEDGVLIAKHYDKSLSASTCPLTTWINRPGWGQPDNSKMVVMPISDVKRIEYKNLGYDVTTKDGSLFVHGYPVRTIGLDMGQINYPYQQANKFDATDKRKDVWQKAFPTPESSCLKNFEYDRQYYFGEEISTPGHTIVSATFFDDDQAIKEISKIKSDHDAWLSKLNPGDQTHCGMVISAQPRIVQVQTSIGAVWLKRDQLREPGTKKCEFINGVYVD